MIWRIEKGHVLVILPTFASPLKFPPSTSLLACTLQFERVPLLDFGCRKCTGSVPYSERQFPNIHYGQSRRISTLVKGTEKKKEIARCETNCFLWRRKRGQKKRPAGRNNLSASDIIVLFFFFPPSSFSPTMFLLPLFGVGRVHTARGLTRREEGVVVVLGKERMQSCPSLDGRRFAALVDR